MRIPLNTYVVYLFCVTFFLHTSSSVSNAAPMNVSTTENAVDIEPESTSSSTPFFEIPRKKTTTVKAIENIAKGKEGNNDSEESSEIYEIRLKPSNNKSQNKKQKLKKNNKNKKDENSEDLLAEFSQGYKKVYSKITHWWRDLESSFAVTPISYEGPSKKVKKESISSMPENKSKSKPTTKKPPVKKKAPPPKKKNQNQREPESWFDWNKVILVLGSIVTVLDLFGIR